MESSQGPCNHCGVKISPQWRNGPPEKEVLCNACGLWYSKKGTLENYAPIAPTERRRRTKRRFRKLDAIVHNQGNLSVDEDVPSCAADPTATKCTTSLSVISSPQNSPILKEAEEDQIPGNSRNTSGATLTDLSHIESLQRDPVYKVEHDPDSAEDVVLIYNANSLLVSPNEIGLGAVKPPSSNFNTKDGSPKDQSKDQSKAST